MEITAGILRGMELSVPAGMDVRPTAVRSRQAFFDSLGDLTGKVFIDICAGSGAMGLEAASRGASAVIFVEYASASLRAIRSNCSKAKSLSLAASLKIVEGAIPGCSGILAREPEPDFLFADPPYPVSMELLTKLTADPVFSSWASHGILFWEMPNAGGGLLPPHAPWKILSIRQMGASNFLILSSKR